MNTQTMTLHITLNKGKTLPSKVYREIVDAIDERLNLSHNEGTIGDSLEIGHIAYEVNGKVVDEYCGS